jgi:hypothetical protein
MDPISLIASVAGIGTAAVALSQAMFNFLDNASNAHHEIEEIAMELSDFSSDIETLRKILNVNQTIYTAQYVDRVQRIIASFRQFEKAIYDVIGKHGRRGKRQKLRVAFGMTKLDRLRGKVETLKRSLSFMVTIVQLALSQRDAQM